MDPNWFYSTLAQSMATIVGLGGGFVFAWLIARRGEIVAERNEYLRRQRELLSELHQYRSTVREIRDEAVQAIRALRTPELPKEGTVSPIRFRTLSHSAYEVRWPNDEELRALEVLPAECDRLIESMNYSREQLASSLLARHPFGGEKSTLYRQHIQEEHPFHTTGIGPENFWQGISMQGRVAAYEWRRRHLQYVSLMDALHSFRSRTVPRSLSMLVLLFGALFVVGVIAPIAFLYSNTPHIKWTLLSLSALVSIAFGALLGREVTYLRSAADLRRDEY